MKINGKFDVKLSPLDCYAKAAGENKLAHLSIDKTFYGDLQATSQGEMLNVMTSVQGSAGYVAIEQLEGSLGGKSGRFVLQHFGTMNKGKDELILQVVPDSGEGELTGLTGSMKINIEAGQHYYQFDYHFEK